MSQENNFIPSQEPYKSITPFRLFVKSNFPFIEATYEALDNYGLYCKVVEYLNNVIENENTVETNVAELYNAFINLNNYVSDYFDNLDVQEEINKKLDQMATTGLLQVYLDNLFDEINNNVDSLQSTVNTLSSRMDTFTHLADGSTTGDAELIDARIGNNGFINNNVGNSIRGQTAYSNEKIENLLTQTFNLKNINSWNCQEGTFDELGYINASTGEPVSNNNFKRTSHFIPLLEKEGDQISSDYIYFRTNGSHSSLTFNFYDENYNFLSRYQMSDSQNYAGYHAPMASKYVKVYVENNFNSLLYISWYPSSDDDFKYYFSKVESIKQDFYVTPLEDKKIVNFGDSIFGDYRGDTSISSYIQNNLKNTVYNVGFGGCRMSQRSETTWNAFSMCNLADAIATNDFTLQDNAISDPTWVNKPEYFESHLQLLKTINFNAIDMITIAYGTNDYTAGVPLDNEDNKEDKNTLAGALRYTIRVLQTAFPDLKILVLSNIWRYFPAESNITSDTKTFNDHTGIDIKNCLLNTSKEMRIPCLDSYENLSLSLYNATNYMVDGTHLDQKGRKIYSDIICGKIKTLY